MQGGGPGFISPGHALTAYDMPVESRDEWIVVARRHMLRQALADTFQSRSAVPGSVAHQNLPFRLRHPSAAVSGSMTSQCSTTLPPATRIRS